MPHKNPAERSAWRKKYLANLPPEKREEIREQEKRAKKKYWANLSPEKRQRERERTKRALRKYLANMTPEKKQRIKKAGRNYGLYRYGLTQQQFDEMLEAQSRCCAICGRPDSGRPKDAYLHIDHCHDSRKVRGLLCDNCNVGLGRFKDDPNLLRLAAAYLDRYK